MLAAPQLEPFFPDLSDPRYRSALAVVHSRFSTNTFPSWPLSHPYRMMAHNGEINTVRGNRNWMRARDAHDDPGALGEQRGDGPGPPGLLRLPLLADGALGRPGAGGVHRRDRR